MQVLNIYGQLLVCAIRCMQLPMVVCDNMSAIRGLLSKVMHQERLLYTPVLFDSKPV